mgnify:CR=1 FL=1
MVAALSTASAIASDHDDGEADLKGRSLSLTDVYAFREDKEIVSGSDQHIVFIINTNPRSLPRQQYYFSTQARYDLHVGRVGTSPDVAAKTTDDVVLRLEFGAPNSTGEQTIKLTSIKGRRSQSFIAKDGGGSILTTPLTDAASPVNSDVTIDGQVLTAFAGLRKDPFFFDVTAFFQFRAAAAGNGGAVPVPGFAAFPTYTPDGVTALDFTREYNVNTIALRVPIAFLQASGETVFDTWASVSVPR